MDSHALIVAIDKYAHARFSPPPFAEAYAFRLNEVLSMPPHGFQVEMLLGPEATKAAVLGALDNIAARPDLLRLFVVFLVSGSSLQLLERDIGMLACYDSSLDASASFLTITEITSLRLVSEARHIGFLFDAPISGQAMQLTRPKQPPADADLRALRAFEAISGGIIPGGMGAYVPITPRLVELLDPTETDYFGFMDIAKRLQRWLNKQNMPPQVLQAGHLGGSQGGEFSFGAAEAVPAHDDDWSASLGRPRSRPTFDMLDEAFSSAAETPEARRHKSQEMRQRDIAEAQQQMASHFEKLEHQKRLLDHMHESLRASRRARSKDTPVPPFDFAE